MRTIVCWPTDRFLIEDKSFKEKVDSMVVLELDVTFNEFGVLQLHVMKLYNVLMKSMFI